jgi:thiamine kinase-like enzyme
MVAMTEVDALERAARLACWKDPVTPEPLSGGITNRNYLVRHRGEPFVVRIGDDIPVHQITRANELAASRAAAACGLSPDVVHHEPGALVIRFIEGRTLRPEDFRDRSVLERILPLVRRCHQDMVTNLRGPVQMFWLPYLLRDYARELVDHEGVFLPDVPRLLSISDELQAAIGAIDIVFSHNDLLAGNFIDDGARIWLIDWDYAGFNSPLFDLANLSSNNELTPADETWLLETYFEAPVSVQLERRYRAMKCGSLLREAMWGMVSEIHSGLDVDYVAYARDYLARLERCLAEFRQL